MRPAIRHLLPVAGLLVMACAGAQHPTPAEQAQQNLGKAQQDLGKAQEEEKKAAEQQKKVADAHEQTTKAQQQLADAQRKESEEIAKAHQLQQQAREHVQQAQRATSTLQPGGAYTQGQRVMSGQVLQADPNQIVVQGRNGRTMTFDIDDRTSVLVGGERRSTADLEPGSDARVAYDDATGRPTALTIQVQPSATAPAPAPGPGMRAVPIPGPENPQGTRGY